MVFGMNKGIFDGTYLKHPTRSGACQSSGATKTLDGKTIVGFIYTFSKLKLICLDVVQFWKFNSNLEIELTFDSKNLEKPQ